MRKALLSVAAVAAATVLMTGAAFAQNTASGNDSTTVIQNHNTSPNVGQQGTGTQANNSDLIDIGSGSTFIEAPCATCNVAVGGTAAQSLFSTAVGHDYTEIDGNSAGGDIYDVGGDAALGLDGAVENGALADGGGIAFGEDVLINDNFAAVGLDGVAAVAQDELVEDGSALVIGNTNSTATASDEAAAVGVNGNAIVINDGPDDNNVIGFNNTVAMSELDQEYSAPVVAGPSADGFLEGVDLGGGPLGPTFAVRQPDGTVIGSNSAYGTLETGQVSNISAADVAGLNDMFFSTGVGNQGHIGSVSAGINSITLN